jgi:hypothetical protein
MLCTILVRSLHMIIFNSWTTTSSNLAEMPTSERANIYKNRTLEEEEVEVGLPGSIDLTQMPSIVAAPASVRRLSEDAASSSSTLTGISISPATAAVNHDHSNIINSDCSSINNNTIYEAYQPREKHGPLHSFAVWCMQQSSFDDLTLFLIFCISVFIFLPLPWDNPAIPFFRLFLYFTMTILLYSASCRLPAKLRIVFHPIILTSACLMAGIAYFERVKGFDIKHGVNLYKTGITFISLVEKTNVGWPGGGDILSVAMDVSIISMAFNVYKSRPDSLREVRNILIYA